MVLAGTLLGCTANPEWTSSSPETCRCLWLLQPDTQHDLLRTLRHRVTRHGLHTSVIILCPNAHPLARTLHQWHTADAVECSIIFEGTVNTLPLLRDHTLERTQYAMMPMTAYWVTDTPDPLVSTNEVVSHLGSQIRKNKGFPPPPPVPGKCTPSHKHDLRDTFWQRWQALTDEARHAIGWPQHRWVTHLNAMNTLLAIAPCRWLPLCFL